MNDVQKKDIKRLREKGLGYSKIAKRLSLSLNTVKSYCQRNNLGGVMADQNAIKKLSCDQCGTSVLQVAGRKRKRFCSDACRNSWWTEHRKDGGGTLHICPGCKKEFKGRKGRKYCSHACYIEDRFGSVEGEARV